MPLLLEAFRNIFLDFDEYLSKAVRRVYIGENVIFDCEGINDVLAQLQMWLDESKEAVTIEDVIQVKQSIPHLSVKTTQIYEEIMEVFNLLQTEVDLLQKLQELYRDNHESTMASALGRSLNQQVFCSFGGLSLVERLHFQAGR
eukprot:TRINITY_DN7957_c0_g1_i4.p2 TRINITY_DN7957_c0_g1~~TRINITY_DN7957_c0_g1_i4.p2  ORF type:complete len:144 (-),score=28.68 TRINITY_DN7957_c0_g1_i4:45-476(-)